MRRNFRFASYLIKCEQSVVLNLAGIKEGVWVALILLAGAELFVKGILGEAESSKVSLSADVTMSVLMMTILLVVALLVKVLASFLGAGAILLSFMVLSRRF